MSDQPVLCFNGINGATGIYLLPSMSADAIAMGEPLDPRRFSSNLLSRIVPTGYFIFRVIQRPAT